MTISDIWCEKYRPSTLDEIVLNSSTRNYFNKIREEKNIPNVMFVGNPGIGKTSLAKIIVTDILNCQYLYINASDENGIDTIRTKVLNFAQTKSLFGQTKVIVLDECDGLSIDAQKALRNSIEEYHDLTRFILTANYKHKIIPALQSRCQIFDLNYDKNEYYGKLISIVKAENVKINKEQFTKIANNCYPDFRKGINALQKYFLSDEKETSNDDTKDLLDGLMDLLINKKYFLIRQSIIENEAAFNNDYSELFRRLFNYIYTYTFSSQDKKRDCLITVSRYFYQNSQCIDQEINFYSCILDLRV
jgi:DNA polymerase III delta prime subunit